MSSDAPGSRAVRLVRAERQQIQLIPVDPDELIAADDKARAIWEFVSGLDLTSYLAEIDSVEGGQGRPAYDPAILLSVWMLATVDGIGSARRLADLCSHHHRYMWLCGGVTPQYRTLSSFRTEHGEKLEELLSQSIASLQKVGLVRLERIAQDGMRVRASAGGGSFRRHGKLEELENGVRERLARLRAELDEDPAACSRRQAAARERGLEDRAARIAQARKAADELKRQRARQARKDGKRKKGKGDRGPDEGTRSTAKKTTEVRASATDPDARVMRFANGGFAPGYNAQFATDVESGVIVGVDASTSGSDRKQLVPMLEQIEKRTGLVPKVCLVDNGYAGIEDITKSEDMGCAVHAPPMKPRHGSRESTAPRKGDTEAVKSWRARMSSEEGRTLYKKRAEVAERVNAEARNRGLHSVSVRGRTKVLAVLQLFALVHNMMRTWALTAAATPSEA